MKLEEYITAIEKYVKGIIVPEFPEMDNFIVHAKSGIEGKGYVYIIFYTKGRRQSWFHNKLRERVQQMRTYLSIPESVMLYYDVNKGNKSL